MGKTRHIQARMSQRGIRGKLLNLALDYGIERRDGRVILNRRGLEVLLQQLHQIQEEAERAMRKGGIVVVREGDALITTYALESYERSKVTLGSDARETK